MALYILIPLILIIVSIATIFFILVRKKSALKNLELDPNADFWKNMTPEIANAIKDLPLEEYKTQAIKEYEKILRRLKIFSLKVENKTSHLLTKVPKTVNGEVTNSIEKQEEIQEQKNEQEIKEEKKEEKQNQNFKNQEQKIIMEIAKNPKDPLLYKKLGSLYLENEMKQDAREAFETALELDPTDEETIDLMTGIKK